MYSVTRSQDAIKVTDATSGTVVYQSEPDGWLVYKKEESRAAGSPGAVEVKVGQISVAYTANVTAVAQVKDLTDGDLIKALASAIKIPVSSS
jgi:hypothetical protein